MTKSCFVLRGPSQLAKALCFSSDGRSLASIHSSDGTAECLVWDLERGKVILKAPVINLWGQWRSSVPTAVRSRSAGPMASSGSAT